MSVTTTHTVYADTLPTWAALRDAYAGSGAVKAKGPTYLPRPAGMKQIRGVDQYENYKARAIWYGATERAVHGLTGAVFRREPTLETPDRLTPQLADVTQTGIPLRSFAEEAVRETLLMGRFGVLVDFPMPTPGPDGRQVPPPATSRPYWIAYQAEEILNWRTMQRQGDTILSLVVLKECQLIPQGAWPSPEFFIVKAQPQYRVLRLNEQGQYEVSVWLELNDKSLAIQDLWIPTRNGEPLDFIPFTFFAPFSLEPQVEKSLLEALVEVNYQYYRHSADYEHGLHLTALPTPYITGNIGEQSEFLIGSATAWVIPDAQATVGMLEFQGHGLQSHVTALENDIKNMAALGARLLESAPVVQETATANQNRMQGAESPLLALVKTVSQGLTQALQTHAWWAGTTENVDDPAITMTLNTDLMATALDAPTIKSLMELLLNNTISYETFYFNLQRGEIARPMIPVEEERELLALRELTQPVVSGSTNGAIR